MQLAKYFLITLIVEKGDMSDSSSSIGLKLLVVVLRAKKNPHFSERRDD